MNLSHAYGHPPAKEDAIRLLHRAYDLGVTHFDTAALYGFGSNETLVGEALKDRRDQIYLASKCVMTGVDGKRVIDGRPESLMRTIDEALQRLQTDYIDLYYLHRWDKNVPIEDSMGAMSRMVEQGKIGGVGLSEMSADTLRKAHAVHPITAMQTEYSLWTRNAEIAVLNACRELGVTFVAFSPVARGFLCDGMADLDSLAEKDIRRNMPRFQEPNSSANQRLYNSFKTLAAEAGCAPGQLALCWLLAQGEDILPIPGTRSIAHLEENLGAAELNIDPSILQAAGELINQDTVSGPRYPAVTQMEIDTEEFSD
jgi:aryl-alcohol dehydrogenase-like predicted oxidoreductase|tara:strand:- start:89 stop:1027 length:939 start_codon:yes stop_codon:yes gene_type:complete